MCKNTRICNAFNLVVHESGHTVKYGGLIIGDIHFSAKEATACAEDTLLHRNLRAQAHTHMQRDRKVPSQENLLGTSLDAV